MRSKQVRIRPIGNSLGIVIPKALLAQLGLDTASDAELTIEADALVLRKPIKPVRTGWAEAAKKISEAGDDALVMGEFSNCEDRNFKW